MDIFFIFFLKKGPPDAVKITFSIFSFSSFLIKFHIEKCSESIGIKFVLYFCKFFCIKSQPHIIDSLFAIKIFFVRGIIFNVGNKPSIPEIEFMQKSIFFLKILFRLSCPK